MDNQDQFDGWVNKWEAAQRKWAAEEVASPTPQKAKAAGSFFGVHSQPLPGDDLDCGQGTSWSDIYARSTELRDEHPSPDSDQVLHEQATRLEKLLGPTNVAPKGPERKPAVPPSARNEFREQAEGWRHLLSQPGKDTTFFHQPQHYASIGMDQGKSPYEPTRVAPNFTDGKELGDLNDLKARLHKLENTLLSQEIKAGKANVPASSYKSKLDSLRKEIDDLSNRLTPEPGRDVY